MNDEINETNRSRHHRNRSELSHSFEGKFHHTLRQNHEQFVTYQQINMDDHEDEKSIP